MIPDTIGNLKSVTLLSLSNNLISGKIPDAFKNLNALEHLDLSKNSISGIIPDFLELISPLKTLNLANNLLMGLSLHNLASSSSQISLICSSIAFLVRFHQHSIYLELKPLKGMLIFVDYNSLLYAPSSKKEMSHRNKHQMTTSIQDCM